MGEVMNVHCNGCGKTWQCVTGNGLLHAGKENIVAAFSKEEQGDVIDLLAAAKIPAYDFQYRLSVCGHCHNVVSVPTLDLSAGDGGLYVGRCPLCGEQTKAPAVAGEEEAFTRENVCPICGSRKLWAEEAGLWD